MEKSTSDTVSSSAECHCFFFSSCFRSWLAKLVKKMMVNAKAAMPILYVVSMSEKKSAKNDTSISAKTRISCTPLRLPKPDLKLIFRGRLFERFSRRLLLAFSLLFSFIIIKLVDVNKLLIRRRWVCLPQIPFFFLDKTSGGMEIELLCKWLYLGCQQNPNYISFPSY
jgi:hypothetical protein